MNGANVPSRSKEALSIGKGAALVAVVLVLFILFGLCFYLMFVVYSLFEYHSVHQQSTDFNSNFDDFMRRMLNVGATGLIIILAFYGLCLGMIFGRGGWIPALVLGLFTVMIVVPIEHEDWVNLRPGLSFGGAYVAAILAPLLAATIAFGVSEIGVSRGWTGIQFENPYLSMAIGCAPYLLLGSLAFKILRG